MHLSTWFRQVCFHWQINLIAKDSKVSKAQPSRDPVTHVFWFEGVILMGADEPSVSWQDCMDDLPYRKAFASMLGQFAWSRFRVTNLAGIVLSRIRNEWMKLGIQYCRNVQDGTRSTRKAPGQMDNENCSIASFTVETNGSFPSTTSCP